jgi:hypothetical protein
MRMIIIMGNEVATMQPPVKGLTTYLFHDLTLLCIQGTLEIQGDWGRSLDSLTLYIRGTLKM